MSTSIIRINLVIITIGAYQNGTLFMLWHKIFAIFPAHIFPAKNFSTVNIFQLKFFQLIIRTISHPRCYCNRMTKKSKVLYWFYIHCRVHKLQHCLFPQNTKVANSRKHFMPHSMLEKFQGLRPYYLHDPCKNFLIILASKAPYSQLFTSNS